MQALWADDEASFDGDHVQFSSSWSWPKPIQHGGDGRPRVPVLHGGAPGPKLFAHIAEYAVLRAIGFEQRERHTGLAYVLGDRGCEIFL